ncbi:protein CEBPZOS [Teleopsis dalmanni]|uniref:protein CEBPZOS n=1 Tax=Teleopsis dalmanni TaxID=139649 RepID=UPI0018CED476|nr:protein CEBPZOS [Teleopsis dalmanni]XP_037958204.1 protein CEBPZOS [Teleopsis dalmanni]
MLPKTPKPAVWKFIKSSAKTLFIFEAVCFAASYAVYYRMNTNRDFRYYINENFPFALDYFYKLGEFLGESNLRQIDSSVWKSETKKLGEHQKGE